MFEIICQNLKKIMHTKHTLAQIFDCQSYPVKIFTYLATQQTVVKHLAIQ
jgi:hypothetical protein